jgi:hypothetical protein
MRTLPRTIVVTACLVAGLMSPPDPAAAGSVKAAPAANLSLAPPNPDCNPAADDRGTRAVDGKNRLDMERDVAMAGDPAHPGTLAAVWTQDWADATTARSSFDGGTTWTAGQFPPGSTHCPASGAAPSPSAVPNSSINPHVAFGPVAADGTQLLYASTLMWDTATLSYEVVVNTSRDRGRTWDDARVLDVGDMAAEVADWSFVAADPRTPGVAYAAWFVGVPQPEPASPLAPPTRFASASMKLSQTSDGGSTWLTTVVHPGALPSLPVCDTVPILRVQPDGALVAFYWAPTSECSARAPLAMMATVSTDGGLHWSEPVTVGTRPAMLDTATDLGHAIASLGGAPGLSAPAFGADGTIWWAWPETSASSTTIRMSHSVDDGRSWTAPAVVRTVPYALTNTNLAVTADGTIGLLSYDLRDERDLRAPIDATVSFATLDQSGRGWIEQILSTFDASTVPDDVGGYEAVVAVPDGFSVLYVAGTPAARLGQTDVFFSHIAVRPANAKP